MYKFNAIMGIKPGIDPAETYRLWQGDHAAYAKNLTLPEVRKYNINRVVYRFGDVKPEEVWGLAEFWFDDLESAQRAVGRVQGAPPDDFHTRHITPAKRFIAQEEEVKLPVTSAAASMIKLLSIFNLMPETDPDTAHRMWREQHAPRAKDSLLPEAKRYTINRILYKYPPAGGKVADFNYYGYEMVLFGDMASALKAAGRLRSAPPDEFLTTCVAASTMVLLEGENIRL